jgi:hypothetical protein
VRFFWAKGLGGLVFYFIFLPLLRFSATYPLSHLIWLLQIDSNGERVGGIDAVHYAPGSH